MQGLEIMDRLNKMDLMLIEEVTCFALRDMEIKQEKGERIDKQKEFDLRMLRRKIGLMRMQEREEIQRIQDGRRYCKNAEWNGKVFEE